MMSFKDAATKAAEDMRSLTNEFANTGFDPQNGWVVRARNTNGLKTISVEGEANTFNVPVCQMSA